MPIKHAHCLINKSNTVIRIRMLQMYYHQSQITMIKFQQTYL